MEIIRRIDELIEDRKAKMEALNIEVEKMEKDIPIKKAQLEEMKKEFSKTLTVELSDDIAELEHSINMLERKVETIKANMEYTPKIETTVEEVKQQYAAELNKLNLQDELNAISVARENYFNQLNNYKSKLMDALSLRRKNIHDTNNNAHDINNEIFNILIPPFISFVIYNNCVFIFYYIIFKLWSKENDTYYFITISYLSPSDI